MLKKSPMTWFLLENVYNEIVLKQNKYQLFLSKKIYVPIQCAAW